MTSSDSGHRGERHDDSGETIRRFMLRLGGVEAGYAMVPDEKDLIAQKLCCWADSGCVDIIVTTGGTGLSPRDVTPEATLGVVERLAPGFSEAMRAVSLRKTPRAMLSRGVSGVRGRCLIINLPGSPGAVQESLDVIAAALPHAIDVLRGQVRNCAAEVMG